MVNSNEGKELFHVYLNESVISVSSFIPIDWFNMDHILFVSSINGKYELDDKNRGYIITEDTEVIFEESWYEACSNFIKNNPNRHSCIPEYAKIPSTLEWKDKILQEFGGYNDIIQSILNSIQRGLQQSSNSRIGTSRCFLIRGIHGTGKTKLAKVIAKYSGLPILYLDGAQCMDASGIEEETTSIFKETLKILMRCSPAILVIDQLERLCPPLDTTLSTLGSIEAHLSSILKTFLDFLHQQPFTNGNNNDNFKFKRVFIIATCSNSNDAIDDCFLRPGRFDSIFNLNIPSTSQREDILQILLKSFPFLQNDELKSLCKDIALLTPGLVAADLEALCNDTLIDILQSKESKEPNITLDNFKTVLYKLRPANLAEYIKPINAERLIFSDFGGLDEVIKQLQVSVIQGIKNIDIFVKLGVSPPSGLLFHGPSGTGKTQMAQALANESGLNLITIQGPELISPIVGQSEKNISELFTKARESSPCILFLDQIDAIATKRGNDDSSNRVRERTLSCLLTEMDGVNNDKRSTSKSNSSIIVIGVTQERYSLDPAILRPGRLDLHLEFTLPDKNGRLKILSNVLQKTPLSDEIDIEELSDKLEDKTGAEIKNYCQEAVLICLREDINQQVVSKSHFNEALKYIEQKPKQKDIQQQPLTFNFSWNKLSTVK